MRNNFVLAAFCALSLCVQTSVAQARDDSSGAKSQHSGTSHRRHYGLVPPPPPMAVSPNVLALYPTGGGSIRFMAAKPRNLLAQEMKLTAVMDDVAFFKVSASDESVHLRAGNCYESVTVAQINPDEVVLEEKGKHFVKRLK